MINIDDIIIWLPKLFKGAGLSLLIALFSACIGIVLGTLLGILESQNHPFISKIITLYVTIIRGTPMLLQIVFLSIVCPTLGIPYTLFSVAVTAIGLNSSAYISQIVRSGIASVSQGQIEAAYTLGISSQDTMRYIVLPQAIRTILPALANEMITLVKDSSLASIIGVTELYQQATIMKAVTYDALTAYSAAALIYLIMTSTLSYFAHKFESYLNSHA